MRPTVWSLKALQAGSASYSLAPNVGDCVARAAETHHGPRAKSRSAAVVEREVS